MIKGSRLGSEGAGNLGKSGAKKCLECLKLMVKVQIEKVRSLGSSLDYRLKINDSENRGQVTVK